MIAEVTDDSIQRVCAHVIPGVAGGAHQVDDSGTGAFGDLVEFALEYQVLLLRSAVDQSDVLAGQVNFLEEGAHRGDPDATGDQQYPRPTTTATGQRTVWAFRKHQRAARDREEPPGSSAARLDGDPQQVAGRWC